MDINRGGRESYAKGYQIALKQMLMNFKFIKISYVSAFYFDIFVIYENILDIKQMRS